MGLRLAIRLKKLKWQEFNYADMKFTEAQLESAIIELL